MPGEDGTHLNTALFYVTIAATSHTITGDHQWMENPWLQTQLRYAFTRPGKRLHSELENHHHRKFVNFPRNKIVIFHSFLYVFCMFTRGYLRL